MSLVAGNCAPEACRRKIHGQQPVYDQTGSSLPCLHALLFLSSIRYSTAGCSCLIPRILMQHAWTMHRRHCLYLHYSCIPLLRQIAASLDCRKAHLLFRMQATAQTL